MIDIKKIGEKMVKQHNRMTQYPLFVIMQKVKRYGEQGWCNEAERKSDLDEDLFCESCAKKQDDGEAPDYCEACDSSCFVWFNWEDEIVDNVGVFFTEEECEEHIRLNGYHYTKPSSYVVSAWRNPEMQEVMRHLITLSGSEIPSHYK